MYSVIERKGTSGKGRSQECLEQRACFTFHLPSNAVYMPQLAKFRGPDLCLFFETAGRNKVTNKISRECKRSSGKCNPYPTCTVRKKKWQIYRTKKILALYEIQIVVSVLFSLYFSPSASSLPKNVPKCTFLFHRVFQIVMSEAPLPEEPNFVWKTTWLVKEIGGRPE